MIAASDIFDWNLPRNHEFPVKSDYINTPLLICIPFFLHIISPSQTNATFKKHLLFFYARAARKVCSTALLNCVTICIIKEREKYKCIYGWKNLEPESFELNFPYLVCARSEMDALRPWKHMHQKRAAPRNTYTSALAAIWATFICALHFAWEMCCNCKNNVWLCGFELSSLGEAFSFAAKGLWWKCAHWYGVVCSG